MQNKTIFEIDDDIIKREKEALRNRNIDDNVGKRIEQLLEEDIYKLTDDERNYL